MGAVGLEGCGKEIRFALLTLSSGLAEMPQTSQCWDTGVCREAALSPMGAGWGLEVGQLFFVSPIGQ